MKKTVLILMAGTFLLGSTQLMAKPEPIEKPIVKSEISQGEPMMTEDDALERINDLERKVQKARKDFADKLGLSEEQKKKADELRQKGRERMEPIMAEMKKLREQAREIREENKKEFEALLTPEQKEILKDMERKADKKGMKPKGPKDTSEFKHHKKIKHHKKERAPKPLEAD